LKAAGKPLCCDPMKSADRNNERELSPADLRGILKYVPQWRNHLFVIAIDGSAFEEDTFHNLMLQLAVLHNLSIRLVVVFGIGHQIRALAGQQHIDVSDLRGDGPTDQPTLELAIAAAHTVSHQLQAGLTRNSLRHALTGAVRATDRGIIRGTDQLLTGKVEKIDNDCIESLIASSIIPVISPIAFTKEGSPRRINSDLLASELAIQLKASKLVFLLPHEGLTYQGKLRLNADVREVREIIDKTPELIDDAVRSKAAYAIRTIDGGTPRAHIIDCRIHDGLLMEVFSKVGIGSMIHSNPYSSIRPARRKDTGAIHALTKAGVRDQSLRNRSRQTIEADIHDYYVYEIDESIIGCFRLARFPRSKTVELGSVFVHPAYQGRNIGKALVDFAVTEATRLRKSRIVALTTQAVPFFEKVCGFAKGSPAHLPKQLREHASASGRNSGIFYREL
jgi:amino-acid N-acetyltransferase